MSQMLFQLKYINDARHGPGSRDLVELNNHRIQSAGRFNISNQGGNLLSKLL